MIPVYEEKTYGRDFLETIKEVLRMVIGMAVVIGLPIVYFIF